MENFDMNNSMVIKLGPDEIKQLIRGQIGFFKDKERMEPNCCMLGLAIVQILDGVGALTRDANGEASFEGWKLYLDGDNECAINVGYSPFIVKQGIIL